MSNEHHTMAMQMFGRLSAVGVSTMLVCCAMLIASPSSAQPAPTKLTPVSINLSWVPTTANQLPFFLARARGYYAAEGLDVTLVPGRGSSLTAQTVGAGQYDIAQADLATMAVVRSKGAPLKAFMVQFARTSSGIVAAKDAGIQDWKDLAGKTVGVTHGGAETYLLPAVFKKLGLDLGKVNLASTPAANKNTAYLSKLVQGISTDVASELPLLDAARPVTPLWYGEVLDVPYHGLFAREDTMQAKPDAVRGVAAAVVKATKAMATDPKAVEEAAHALAAANPAGTLEVANLVAAWKLYAHFQTSPLTEGQPIGSMSTVGWQRTLDILREYAGFTGSSNPNDYFTNAFLPK
jgi:NitT/TauT family transport system substrate-binding protein